MPTVLEGVRVLDLTTGAAGAVAGMLLGDYGADVVRVARPLAEFEAPDRNQSPVWDRGKRLTQVDLGSPQGKHSIRSLALAADVLLEDFSPGAGPEHGIDCAALLRESDSLIVCSITGYGRHAPAATRPANDSLVQARSGLQDEQPGLRPGPVFLHAPLPSLGAALLACTTISAALHVREVTGRGQWVETSLMQGALLWTTMIWNRAAVPQPSLTELFKFKDHFVSPPFQGSDGLWFHPMPNAIPVALGHLGRDPEELPAGAGRVIPNYDERAAHYRRLRQLFASLPAHEWVEVLQSSDVRAQPVLSNADFWTLPQLHATGGVTTGSIAGIGDATQFGHAYHLGCSDELLPRPPQRAEVADVAGEWAVAGPPRLGAGGDRPSLPMPLAGIRVLDFGTALAGPFGTMILAQLGADVIKIDPVTKASDSDRAGDVVWAGSGRGKRSICLDLKSPEGREVVERLIRTADVLHYNLRVGVAERLGISYEQVRALKPDIIYCHVTGYGTSGPMAAWPGSDQMGQALSGLEYEQGATARGGFPTWYRFGMCDATAGMLSVLGVLQALYHRDRTGRGQTVEADILAGAGLLMSEAYAVDGSGRTTRRLDRSQTGIHVLERLYETQSGWICVVARRQEHWARLSDALGVSSLASDPRFATPDARDEHQQELSSILEPIFRRGTAESWFRVIDGAGVPCEISVEGRGTDWFHDPDAIANGWVVRHPHPVYGELEQPGQFMTFMGTPIPEPGPLPLVGEHTEEVLLEMNYRLSSVAILRDKGVIN